MVKMHCQCLRGTVAFIFLVKIKDEGGPGQNSCADLPCWLIEKNKELRALSFCSSKHQDSSPTESDAL